MQEVKNRLKPLKDIHPSFNDDLRMNTEAIANPGYLADFVASSAVIDYKNKQIVLEAMFPKTRLEKLLVCLEEELMLLQCEHDIQLQVRQKIDRNQKDYFLREQIKAIHSHSCLHFTGTYTHFACGEGQELWELEFTRQQFDRYTEACRSIESAGLSVGVRHCCSTGGSLIHPEYQLDMVRLGMLPVGNWRYLTPEEVRNLVMATGVTKKIAAGYIKYGKEPDRDYHTARR